MPNKKLSDDLLQSLRWKELHITEDKVGSDMVNEYRKKTIGRELAEKRAKEELDRLPKVDVPDFNSFKDFAFFVRDFLFNCSEEELRSFILHNLDKNRYFIEGSDYLLDYNGNTFYEKVIDDVFGDEQINFRTVYCPTLVNGRPEKKNVYTFGSRNGSRTATIAASVDDNGKFRLWTLDLSIPNRSNFSDDDCPAPPMLEALADNDFNFKIKFPNGYDKKLNDVANGDKHVVYSWSSNGQEFVLDAYKYKSLSGASIAKSDAKETVQNSLKRYMIKGASYDEEYNDWELEGAPGVEANFLIKPRGVSGSNPGDRTWYRGILINDVLYQLFIKGENWSDIDREFMKSLEYTGGEVKFAVEAGDVTYKKGDMVEILVTGRWFKAEVKDVLDDGLYHVFAYDQNKNYKASADNIRYDPNPPKSRLGGSGGNKGRNIKVPRLGR